MKKFKTVTRRYTNKKGEVVEKQYKYLAKEKDLVTKYNKVNQKLYDQLLANHVDENGNRLGDYYEYRDDLDYVIQLTIEYNKRNKHGKKSLSLMSARSKMADSSLERLLLNSGFNPDDDSTWRILGVSREDFFNQDNWSGSILTVNGIRYMIKFNYDGTILERI